MAELIGIKVFVNEFVAYNQLATFVDVRDSGLVSMVNGTVVNWVDEKSEAIATYALCGFANIGSLGIVLGIFGLFLSKKKVKIYNCLKKFPNL